MVMGLLLCLSVLYLDMLIMGSEYGIQMEIIKSLVEIESQMEDKNMREIGSLKRELKIFKKNFDE